MFSEVKKALVEAFSVDLFLAYEQFAARKLRDGEFPDAYLKELRRLASLFGAMTDKGFSCAFVAGLPETVCQLTRAGSRVLALDLHQIPARARAVIRDDCSLGLGDACLEVGETDEGYQQAAARSRRCFVCNGAESFRQELHGMSE